MFHSTNPYTGQRILEFEYHTRQQTKDALENAHKAYADWKNFSIKKRAALIKRVGEVFQKNKEEAALTATNEMGKPIKEAIAEVEKCILLCDFYSENGEKLLANQKGNTDFESWVTYEPIGVILGIMPWNYPYWQIFRFAIPTLLAGNTVIVKHALNVPECALLLEKVFSEALENDNVYTNLFLSNERTENLIVNDTIKGVSVTGGTAAGKAVADKAANGLKPIVLELGGSNALVVFKDANLEKTVATCVKGRFMNNGQSCIAGKRLLLAKEIYTDFVNLLVEKVGNLKTGDPKDETTEISVLAKREFVMDLDEQLDQSVSKGATLLIGGKNEGYFFEPTLVSDVTPDMKLFKEETFGPVLPIIKFETVEEAIELANNTSYGLGVSLFTEDIDFAKSIIPKFEDGAVFINSFVKSIPQLPFGGSKISGLGRELADEGLKAFTNIKTVVVG